jgi:hypothetical protein
MSAQVLSLDSHRRNRPPACGCPRHELNALLERLRHGLLVREGLLLVDREDLVELVQDVEATAARLLPPRARTGR